MEKEKEKEKPEYLYHYTNINTLALILKHKTIRFNSLNKVDDLSEGVTDDLGAMGKYIFVSSWTESPEESIPFWKMYTKDMGGVRIRLKSYPFVQYQLPKNSKSNFIVSDDIYTYFKPDFFFNEEYLVLPKWDILEKVEYTNKIENLFPEIIKIKEGKIFIPFGSLGIYKREEWSFQKEWRYKIIFLPISLDELNKYSNNLAKAIHDRLWYKRDLPFDDIYLDIADDALNRMEITLGPCVNEGDKLIVESLVEKYCQNATIKNSVLENTIRI